MGCCRGVLRPACLQLKVFLFSVGVGECPLGVVEGHDHRGWVAVHDGLLVRAVVYLHNAHLVVFANYRVMLGVDFGSVLGRDDWGKTETQHHTVKRYSHSHVASLDLRDSLQTRPTLIRQVSCVKRYSGQSEISKNLFANGKTALALCRDWEAGANS